MWITRKGYTCLLQEFTELKETLKSKLKELGDQAERDSDLPENPIWKQLQVEIRFNIPRKIAEIQKSISEAQIIEDMLLPILNNDDKAHIGSKVRIKFSNDDKEYEFIIVGPYDLKVFEKAISYLSPLGRAILNTEEGEEKAFMAPSGERIFAVLSIQKGL